MLGKSPKICLLLSNSGFLFKGKYDLAYFDRPNIVLASIFSFCKVKTIVRFLDISNFVNFTNKISSSLLFPLVYLSLKIQYSLVICSEDGSCSRNLFTKCLNKKAPVQILLNGVDTKEASECMGISLTARYVFSDKFPILLFVGRLTADKGAAEFVDALI